MNPPKFKNKPYTYLIGWSSHNKWYYGVRYSKKCSPSDLWNTYFTSSKHVHKFREKHGEPDIIQIRRLFDNCDKALNWEQNVLKKMHVKSDNKWLNNAIGKPSFSGKKHSEETKQKMRKPKPSGFGEKIKKAKTGVILSEKTKMKIGISNKGKESRAKKWVFSFNNKNIEILNLAKYCRENNLNISCMKDVYYGRQKQHKNHKRVY